MASSGCLVSIFLSGRCCAGCGRRRDRLSRQNAGQRFSPIAVRPSLQWTSRADVDFRYDLLLLRDLARWRRILHCNVTKHPTAAWVSQQLRETFSDDCITVTVLRPRYSKTTVLLLKASGRAGLTHSLSPTAYLKTGLALHCEANRIVLRVSYSRFFIRMELWRGTSPNEESTLAIVQRAEPAALLLLLIRLHQGLVGWEKVTIAHALIWLNRGET